MVKILLNVATLFSPYQEGILQREVLIIFCATTLSLWLDRPGYIVTHRIPDRSLQRGWKSCMTQSGKFTACSKLLVTYLVLISILTITKSISVMVPATTKHFDRPGKIHRLQILLFNQLLNWWEHYVWHSCLSL